MSSSHKPKYLYVEEPGSAIREGHRVKCSCRWASPLKPTKQQAEDEYLAHMKVVERVRTHLSGTPSLRGQRNYYLEMAGRVDLPAAEREQWQMLADELSTRLNDGEPKDEQLRLV